MPVSQFGPFASRCIRLAGYGALSTILLLSACRTEKKDHDVAVATLGEALSPFDPQPIGDPIRGTPLISHVDVVDLDQDGLKDVIVCDCQNSTVSWIRQDGKGEYKESVLAANLPAPAHAECADLDGDGDLDIAVAVLGKLFPSNDKIGSVVILENDAGKFSSLHIVLEQTHRVSDVRAGDIDKDGDLDLLVTQFGYNEGQVVWMENSGGFNFQATVVQSLEGGIHGILEDINGDDNLDAVVLISQDHEKVFTFEGDGQGNFVESLIYQADTNEFGSSGIWVEDLDQDGQLDILFTNGDAFDYSPPHPWPWHGVQWLRNEGNGSFEYQRLTALGGAVCAAAVDFDGDGDVDIFAGSTFNDWESPDSASLILLTNQGDMSFTRHFIANTPTHIQSIAVADMDDDGQLDLVTGGMHVFEPYDRVQRIQLWRGISR